jgi:acetyl-CoA/propionyl-CoA carboxylase, biotin carboxylase, biotin carboxyl carrier protein
MFRVAEGEELGFDDPVVRGHSIEFRINGEDPGRNFLPTPGTVTTFRPPSGPGVRVDAGVEPGSVVGQNFDSLLAKLVVTGATRRQAVERARRALAEFEVAGLATVIPFHRAVLDDPAFVPAADGEPFTVHTRWIETEWDNPVAPYAGSGGSEGSGSGDDGDSGGRERVTVEVGGKRLEVVLPAGLGAAAGAGSVAGAGVAARRPARRGAGRAGAAAVSGDALTSPMQGTIIKVVAEDGQTVAEGDVVVVMEAMKMEQPIAAHKAGTVTGLTAEVGATIGNGAVICTIEG